MPVICQINTGREMVRESEHRRKADLFLPSEVEVSGTVSKCDVGRMSSLVLWCSHCAPTVLLSVESAEPQL